jgi:hypothetical protein
VVDFTVSQDVVRLSVSHTICSKYAIGFFNTTNV